MITRGMRLRDFPSRRCTLRDLYVIVHTALTYPNPTDPIALAVMGEDALWSLEHQLLAGAFDNLSWLAWAKSKDAQDHPNRPPKQLPRPGVEDAADNRHFGSDPIPLDELADWLGWETEMKG